MPPRCRTWYCTFVSLVAAAVDFFTSALRVGDIPPLPPCCCWPWTAPPNKPPHPPPPPPPPPCFLSLSFSFSLPPISWPSTSSVGSLSRQASHRTCHGVWDIERPWLAKHYNTWHDMIWSPIRAVELETKSMYEMHMKAHGLGWYYWFETNPAEKQQKIAPNHGGSEKYNKVRVWDQTAVSWGHW